MYTLYRLNESELDDRFIENLKTLFKGKEIEIVISEVDETAYLLQSEPNRERLLQTIQRINSQQNLIEAPTNALQ